MTKRVGDPDVVYLEGLGSALIIVDGQLKVFPVNADNTVGSFISGDEGISCDRKPPEWNEETGALTFYLETGDRY